MRASTLSFTLAATSFLLSGLAVSAQTPAPNAPVPSTPVPSGPMGTAAAAAAASTSKDSKLGKDIYAAEPFVIERSDLLFSEKADGTGFRQRTVAVRMQSEPALREFGVINIPFASASEHVELIYVRVRHADGSVTETPVSGAIEQPEPVTKQAPFYSDLKDEQLPVKGLKIGDTLEWQAKIIRTRAEAVNNFWGQEHLYGEGMVILNQTLELRYPASVKVTVWTNSHEEVKPEESTDGDMKVVRWSKTQLKPTTGAEADAAKKLKKAKKLTDDEEEDDDEGKLPTLAWTTFPSWEAVGAWYRGLEGERAKPDAEIQGKVKELTASSKTEEEKVRAVYAYVSAQVRYIGVAFGVGRYQPHEAVDVLHNQYGDCKDKATLLASMLEAIGLQPDSVLIGAGVRFNEAVPSPSAFNHLINRVKVGNDEVWLDATQEVAPYRALLSALRDKNALVVPESGPAKVEKSPKELPFAAYQKWVAKGSITPEGVIESHIALESRGDGEIMLRSYVHQVPPSSYDEFAQKFVESLGYAGTTSHADFSRPEDSSGPFTMAFDYKREKNDQWDNLKIIPQFAPVYLPSVNEKEPPTKALELGEPTTQTSTAELKLPEGWGAELPEAIHEKMPWVTEDVTYRVENGTLFSERKVVVLQSKVPASEWKAYKKFTDAVNLGFDKYIVLIRPGASGKAPVSTAHAHASNAEAEALVGKAYEAARTHDLKGAENLLKQAKSLDPETKGLWSAYGWVAYRRGKYTEAVEDYRKELSLYPATYHLYEYLAMAQWAHKDKDAAVASVREWTALNPDSAEAQQQLGAYLLLNEKAAEAADAAAKAVALTPATEKEKLESRTMLLGNAQMKAGQKEKATDTLKGLLETTSNPAYMNDAAYELADAKLLLPLDQEKISEALKKMDAETQAWTLDEAPGTLIAKSNLLVASWDTYGWILYRAGKTAEAKDWIQPAYLNQFHAEVKKHLDEIDGVLGRSAETLSSNKAELQSRTFALGAYTGGKATAEYRVLLQHGKVLRSKATGTELPFVDGLLKDVSFARLFPTGSDAKLVRTGIVNCVGGKCEFVMEP